jgi:hypothetical protein
VKNPANISDCLHNFHFLFFFFVNLTDLEDESVQNRLKCDEERKYGKIPTRIYLLYLKACGIPTLLVFFLSTFLWQALRVYTDVWLRDWTDSDDATDVCETISKRLLGF